MLEWIRLYLPFCASWKILSAKHKRQYTYVWLACILTFDKLCNRPNSKPHPQKTHFFKAGTALAFGTNLSDQSDVNYEQLDVFRTTTDGRNDSGYVQMTFMDAAKTTQQDEFILGVQSFFFNRDVTGLLMTLLYAAGSDRSGDYLHVYVVSEWHLWFIVWGSRTLYNRFRSIGTR